MLNIILNSQISAHNFPQDIIGMKNPIWFIYVSRKLYLVRGVLVKYIFQNKAKNISL